LSLDPFWNYQQPLIETATNVPKGIVDLSKYQKSLKKFGIFDPGGEGLPVYPATETHPKLALRKSVLIIGRLSFNFWREIMSTKKLLLIGWLAVAIVTVGAAFGVTFLGSYPAYAANEAPQCGGC
jgi:hypothetical protein